MVQHCDYPEQKHSLSDIWQSGGRITYDGAEESVDQADWKQTRQNSVEFANSNPWEKYRSRKGESTIRDQWHINKPVERRLRTFLQESIKLKDARDENGEAIAADETVARAVSFVKSIFNQAIEEFNIEIDIPDILPGPNKSIDIFWNFPNYEMLVNVPASAAVPLTYYGDDRGDNVTKGTLPTLENARMVLWLIFVTH